MTSPSRVPANCSFLFITSCCNYTWGKLLHIYWNLIDYIDYDLVCDDYEHLEIAAAAQYHKIQFHK